MALAGATVLPRENCVQNRSMRHLHYLRSNIQRQPDPSPAVLSLKKLRLGLRKTTILVLHYSYNSFLNPFSFIIVTFEKGTCSGRGFLTFLTPSLEPPPPNHFVPLHLLQLQHCTHLFPHAQLLFDLHEKHCGAMLSIVILKYRDAQERLNKR